MAFLDQFAQRVSQAGQTTVRKAKDVAEIARLSGLIAEDTRRINGLYAQLGRQYAAAHGDDPDCEYAEELCQLREQEERVARYRKQMQSLKGLVPCANCGAEIPVNAAFCSVCGGPAPRDPGPDTAVPDQPAALQCPQCGEVYLGEAAVFCSKCGQKLK